MAGGPRARAFVVYVTLAVGCDAAAPPRDATVDADAVAGDGAPRDAPRKVPGRTDLCFDALVPSGFGFGWRNLNHRIARVDIAWSGAPGAGCRAGASRGATLAATFVGGTFTTGVDAMDFPAVVFDRYVVGASEPAPGDAGTAAPPASVRSLRGVVTLEIPPSQEARATVTVPLPGDLPPGTVVEPILDGFALRTDVPQGADYPREYDPAAGYTSRGVAFALQDIARDGAGLRFVAYARFAHGPADRPDMNRAIPVARTRAELRWQVLLVPAGAATTIDVRYRMTHPRQRPFDRMPLPPVPVERTRGSGSLPPGLATVVAGLRQVDFRAFPDATGGDYIREYSARVLDLAYDRGSGRVALRVDGYASNASILTYLAMDYFFDARAVVLGWAEGPTARQVRERVEFEVPSTTRPLALEPGGD